MTISLESLKPCLQGIIPSTIMTCSSDGIPNVSYLSQVHYVDSSHVALTSQYFNNTRRNLSENPMCRVRVIHPESFVTYNLLAKHIRSETSGPVYQEMYVRLAAIADHSGASDLLRLKAVEILEVLEISPIEGESNDALPAEAVLVSPPRFSVAALQSTCERVNRARTLDEAFDCILQAMDLEFGFRNSMILLPDDNARRLSTIATRGYEQNGVGSEIEIGEGVIGRAAETKVPLAHASLAREFIYANTVRTQAMEHGLETHISEVIPLPGLAGSRSQIAIPLLIRNELLGVLFAESERIFEFKEEDIQLLRTLGSVLAIAINGLQLLHRMGEEPAPSRATESSSLPSPTLERLVVIYYEKDECLFVNGEYLIRGLPAKILWKLLKQHQAQQKSEFTNRELRMDQSLQLPEIKDNLESRLILLRKRLEKKCPFITISPSGRGRFCLQLSAKIVLETA
jgi:adenylate cyclase